MNNQKAWLIKSSSVNFTVDAIMYELKEHTLKEVTNLKENQEEHIASLFVGRKQKGEMM